MKILIRRALVEDAAEIARVRVTTWQAAYRGLIDQAYLDQMDVAVETKKWREGLRDQSIDRSFFVAQTQDQDETHDGTGGTIVGYVITGRARDPDPEFTAEIYALYILPDYQEQGIGRSLVHEAVNWLIGKGYQTMIIYVLRENISARKFYEAMGGRVVREHTRETTGLILSEVGYGYNLAAMNGQTK